MPARVAQSEHLGGISPGCAGRYVKRFRWATFCISRCSAAGNDGALADDEKDDDEASSRVPQALRRKKKKSYDPLQPMRKSARIPKLSDYIKRLESGEGTTGEDFDIIIFLVPRICWHGTRRFQWHSFSSQEMPVDERGANSKSERPQDVSAKMNAGCTEIGNEFKMGSELLNFNPVYTPELGHMERSETHVTSSQWGQWNLGRVADTSWQHEPKHPEDAPEITQQQQLVAAKEVDSRQT
ncbi:hypothetical protein EI94DRAFT_1706128 [Lactarius quietus]|nr:hypothetical protein EI94DRAFT_1706128 [Lactarius quietus]